jgi:cation:H+ antiporter
MTVVWIGLLLGCVVVTSVASRFAVTSALRVADNLDISPALVGLTVMSIGTDLPEMANSIVSSASGHGDVNVGDSMGSAFTQVTLTLGLLCLAGGKITTNRNFVLAVGTATVFASAVVRMLLNDGDLGRRDGLVLIALWLAGTALLGHGELRPREAFESAEGVALGRDVMLTLGWLGVVGVMAVLVVQLFLSIAEAFGIPEFVGSFIALAVGTSLPELFVDWTAIRRGASSMAVGDLFGSSFVDATLSIGIGPALFATTVSDQARAGTLVVAIGVLVATVFVARAKRYDWRLALPLLALYLVVQVWIAGSGAT